MNEGAHQFWAATGTCSCGVDFSDAETIEDEKTAHVAHLWDLVMDGVSEPDHEITSAEVNQQTATNMAERWDLP
jgi:hypothetical protein